MDRSWLCVFIKFYRDEGAPARAHGARGWRWCCRWLCTEMLLLLSALSGPAAPAEVLSGLAELTVQGLSGAPPQLGAQKWLSAAPGVRITSTRPARRSLCCPSGLSSLSGLCPSWLVFPESAKLFSAPGPLHLLFPWLNSSFPNPTQPSSLGN